MEKLTGKFYHEVEGVWSQSLVLHVEVVREVIYNSATDISDPKNGDKYSHTTWRKATMKDLNELHCIGVLPNGR